MTMTMSRGGYDDDYDDEEDDDFWARSYMQITRTNQGWRGNIHASNFLRTKLDLFPPEPNVTPGKLQKELEKTFVIATKINQNREIEELLWKQFHPERDDRMDAIQAEVGDYTYRILHSIGIDPNQHPHTFSLVNTLSFIASLIVMNWKRYYWRARPSQINRHIDPAILVPAHFSFPSGHSTEVHLIAEALKHVLEGSNLDANARIDHEATEIAENREWAGVHYASDTQAGKILAGYIWEAFKSWQEDGKTRFPPRDEISAEKKWKKFIDWLKEDVNLNLKQTDVIRENFIGWLKDVITRDETTVKVIRSHFKEWLKTDLGQVKKISKGTQVKIKKWLQKNKKPDEITAEVIWEQLRVWLKIDMGTQAENKKLDGTTAEFIRDQFDEWLNENLSKPEIRTDFRVTLENWLIDDSNLNEITADAIRVKLEKWLATHSIQSKTKEEDESTTDMDLIENARSEWKPN